MVSLWDLLLLLCFTMPIAGALLPAHSAKVGFNGYTVAIVVGVALGLGCSWSMRTIGKKISVSTRPYSASRREGYFRALYFAGVLWIAFAFFLGTWASSAALRFVATHS